MARSLFTDIDLAFLGLHFGVSAFECLLLAALYVSVGMLLWERFTLFGRDADCPLVQAERYGSYTMAEAAAFMTVKIVFVAFWPACLVFYAAAQSVARVRHYLSPPRIAG